MDPNTAYRHLQLSDGGRKATLKAENLNPPDHPDRFHFWRQVLCREPLGGSPYYWEVEWTGPKVQKSGSLMVHFPVSGDHMRLCLRNTGCSLTSCSLLLLRSPSRWLTGR